jgi:hypothetical protein
MRKAALYSSLFRAVLLCFSAVIFLFFSAVIFVGFRAAILIARPLPSLNGVGLAWLCLV